jgi:LysM repeat protein
MKTLTIVTPIALALLAASCASQKSESTATPGYADASQLDTPAAPSSNPVYDSKPAYDESSSAITPSSGAVTANIADAPVPTPPSANSHVVHGTMHHPSASSLAPKPPLVSSVVHTVVAGDTLSGISHKYKVSVASIKAANAMTKDTVVLGRKMIIPTR